MKRIIVATDLSPAADRAVEYGLKLAAALDAAVTLIGVYEEIPVPVADTMSLAIIEASDIGQQVEAGLLRQRNLFKQGSVQAVQTLAVKGPVAASILKAAEEMQAEMIIAGMKGKGKAVRRLFGSTVTVLARKTPIPLLIVPEDTGYAPPAAILLGNDVGPGTDMHVLDALRELVAVFSSKLYALRVVRKGAKEFIGVLHGRTPLQDLDKTWDVKYEYEMGKDVVGVLNEFVRTHSIGMVVMLPHPHFIPERWVTRSHTHEMIFDSKIPLLILPEKG